MLKDFQLRFAAGLYWLLDMKQDGLDYHRPICMNEGGAYLWRQLEQGIRKEELVDKLCDEFGLEKKCAKEDVESFFLQLKQSGISLI